MREKKYEELYFIWDKEQEDHLSYKRIRSKTYIQFENECLSFLNSEITHDELAKLCEFLGSYQTEFPSQKNRAIEPSYKKFVQSLKDELLKYKDNFSKWSIWDRLPQLGWLLKEKEIDEMVFQSIRENNPSKEDLELIKKYGPIEWDKIYPEDKDDPPKDIPF
jgi:hypothetical protein